MNNDVRDFFIIINFLEVQMKRLMSAWILPIMAGGFYFAIMGTVNAEEEPDVGFSGLVTYDIQVRDRTEAIIWFKKVLGFDHLFTAEEINWAEVRSPLKKLTIGFEEVRDRPIRTSSIDFGVLDIGKARKVLESRGAAFVGETVDYGPVVVARFRDPSGNMFNIFQGK
jgi:predicted enzyme related to lactoylglutathione lyase